MKIVLSPPAGCGRTTLRSSERPNPDALTFAIIPRRPGTPEYDPETADEYTTFARPDSRLRAPLAETVGIRAVNANAGQFEATLFPYVANSVGVLQGGVIAMLADAACEGAASALAGARHTTSDLSLRYLRRGTSLGLRH